MVAILGTPSRQEQLFKTMLVNNIPPNVSQIDIQIYENGILKKHLYHCSVIDFVGRSTKGNKKADIKISHSTGNFLISLKNKKFRAWQSADSLSGNDVDEIMLDLFLKRDQAFHYNFKFNYINKKYEISDLNGKRVSLIVGVNKNSKEEIVFGSDILGNGAVMKIDQEDPNTVSNTNGILIINVLEYIDDKRQLDNLNIVYKINNIEGARGTHFPGVRVEAVPAENIGMNSIYAKYKNANIII